MGIPTGFLIVQAKMPKTGRYQYLYIIIRTMTSN